MIRPWGEFERRELEQRLLLELRLAAKIGAILYAPTHVLLALLDFKHAPRPVEGLAVRLLSVVAVWILVWMLHKRIRTTRYLGPLNFLVYAAAMTPVFAVGIQMPSGFFVAFLPTLVALAVFLPGQPRDLIGLTGLFTALGVGFTLIHHDTVGSAPDTYLIVGIVNTALIAAGGAYLSARRRLEAVRWLAQAQRLTETLRFGEDLAGLGLLEPPQLAELRRLAEGNTNYSRQEFLADLVAKSQLSAWQSKVIVERGVAALRVRDWVLVDFKGEGGMGEVFSLRHLKTGESAALKRLLPASLARPETIARFRREISVSASLDHPNIIRTIEVVDEDRAPALIMEYVGGGSLADRLKGGKRLSAAAGLALAREIASALEHAHSHGVVHRDIKPENILLAESGAARLGDFGLARIHEGPDVTALTQSGVVMGTLDYMAPEQASDSRHVDIRADLYSLGCTLYHAVTGRVPFPTETTVRKILAHQTEVAPAIFKSAPEVPPVFAAVIHRLMAKRPEDRFQSPAELLAALESMVASRG